MISTRSSWEIHPTAANISPRVVVIDDEPLVSWSLAAGLRHAGFDAIATGTAEGALAHIRRLPAPAAVLLDVDLWGVDHRALLAMIRQCAPECVVLLLAVEGKDVPSDEGVSVIRKPFDLPAVVACVEAALQARANGAKLTL